MLKIPAKHSYKWRYVLLVVFSFAFLSLAAASAIQGLNIQLKNILGYVILSVIVSFLITVGGYLGSRIYFIIASFSNILAVAYMIYMSVSKTAEGWTDLVSFISYMFITAVGLLLGVAAQSVSYLTRRK